MKKLLQGVILVVYVGAIYLVVQTKCHLEPQTPFLFILRDEHLTTMLID